MAKRHGSRTAADAPFQTRHCSKCGRASKFVCSGKFRVNANGKHLDVWLIYRCQHCGTSWNQEIYARASLARIGKELYQSFLENDWETAMRFAENDGRKPT